KVVVPITLDYARPFFDGLARVEQNQETRYINPSGETVINLKTHAVGGDFSEGLVAVDRFDERGGPLWITDYLDTHGKTVFRVEASGEEFHEGLAAASVIKTNVPGGDGDKRPFFHGFIDKRGNWVILPVYREVREFSDGLAAVRPEKTTINDMGDSWGYIDR